jgi:putative ABC transport system permease protein
MGALMQDVRYGLRLMTKRPGFTATVVLTLSLGIGANVALFTVLEAVVLRPLPYGEPESLVRLFEANAGQGREREGASPANFLDWRRRSDSFEGLAASYAVARPILDEQGAEQVMTAQVTEDFFRVLGVEPVAGRAIAAEEFAGALTGGAGRTVGGHRVVVISHGLWTRRFGRDPSAVGRKLTMDGQLYEVVGAVPEGFDYPDPLVDLWSPWDIEASFARRYAAYATKGRPRDWRFLRVVGRLGEGIGVSRAQQEMTALAAALEGESPDTNRGWGVRVVRLHEELVRDSRPVLAMLMGAAGCLLLLVCANVANLVMARGSHRSREVALRQALGAPRMRLVSQLLTESMLVAILGGGLGLIVTYAGVPLLRTLAPAGVPRIEEVAVDGWVLAFAVALSVLTGVAFGLVPALRGSNADVTAALREGGWSFMGGRHRARRVLVVSQVSLAVVLLLGAGLLARSFARLRAVDTGFDPRNLLVLRLSVDRHTYPTSGEVVGYYEKVIEALSALPGVARAAATTVLPMSDIGVDFNRPYWRFGGPRPDGDGPKVDIRMVTTSYFDTMGMRLLSGRNFTPQDRRGTPAVVVINQNLATRLWPETGAVGERIVLDYNRGVYAYEVVGVVNDSRYYGPRTEPRPEVFIPHAQNPYPALNVVVRTRTEPGGVARIAELAARDIDATQPVYRVTTMEELLSASMATDRLAAVLLGGFGAAALLVAALGVYGVLSILVAERTREMGLRVALGAARRDILTRLIGQGMMLVLVGMTLGGVGALLLSRLLGGLLYGVSPTDPATFSMVAAVLALVALVACYLPARRATRIDPTMALRFE